MTNTANKNVAKATYKKIGKKPLTFQIDSWDSVASGKNSIIMAPTGFGKTFAALLPIMHSLSESEDKSKCQAIYISPLRAINADMEINLRNTCEDLEWHVKIGSRTGDTSSYQKQKIYRSPPQLLVTTPESLAVMLTHKDHRRLFGNLKHIIIDEWHDLLPSKRGTLLSLNLEELQNLNAEPIQKTVMSATIGDQQLAVDYLKRSQDEKWNTIRHQGSKSFKVEILESDSTHTFPWFGHYGKSMLLAVACRLSHDEPSIVFVNTRAQAEWWHTELNKIPHLENGVLLHHGSLSKELRENTEARLRSQSLAAVVSTSSLDLGVDFQNVKKVFQIGSPRGLQRFVQRAGRSGHSPGEKAHIVCVPTHSLEIIEFVALKRSLKQPVYDVDSPVDKPLDVLVQHLVSKAIATPYIPDKYYDQLKGIKHFKNLGKDEYRACIQFVLNTEGALKTYPRYRRAEIEEDKIKVTDKRIKQIHLMNMGTIVDSQMIGVQFASGKKLGQVEESFATRLNSGDVFTFAGRALEYLKMTDDRMIVKPSSKKSRHHPVWKNGRMPMSNRLSKAVMGELENFGTKPLPRRLKQVLEMQRKLSDLPHSKQCLIECFESKDGSHLFIFPFAGYQVHERLAPFLAHRMSRKKPATISMSFDDYGIEFLTDKNFDLVEALCGETILSLDDIEQDIFDCMNTSEMASMHFAEIARIAGLITQNHPGGRKQGRQLQVSSSLLFKTLDRFEPDHFLIKYAYKHAIEVARFKPIFTNLLHYVATGINDIKKTTRPSPLAFPIMANRLAAKISNEELSERIERMIKTWTTV